MNIKTINTDTYNQIRFSDDGQGQCLVLLHGYLEAMESWQPFSDELSKQQRVITIDLPGHGKTSFSSEELTIEQMADAVYSVLEHADVKKAVIIGHSMGGYVTLAFAKKYPQKTAAFCLFHSHPFADIPATANNRLREIDLIQKGKKKLIVETSVPKGFANSNLERFKTQIENATQIAKQTTDTGIIAALTAMKNRPSSADWLQGTDIPFLYIIGKQDNYIPIEMLDKISFPENTTICILENSGHSGFIEEPETSLAAVLKFIETIP